MRRLLPPFIGCCSQRQKEDTAHAQAIAAFYRLSQSAPEGHGACAGYCRLLKAVAAGHSQNRRRMRRLLPPFIGCRSKRQKEDTAHAQAIAASSKLSHSAPEGRDGACAGYCLLLKAAAFSAIRKWRRMRRLFCRLFQAAAFSARKNRRRMRAPLSPPLAGCYSHRPEEQTAQTDSVRGSENRRIICGLLPLAKEEARCHGACAGYCTPSGFCCCSWTHEWWIDVWPYSRPSFLKILLRLYHCVIRQEQ